MKTATILIAAGMLLAGKTPGKANQTSALAASGRYAKGELLVKFSSGPEGATAAIDADADGDGAVNQLEYLVGSNPLLAGDAWKISIQRATSSVQILFPRVANRAFEVQWTSNLLDSSSWVAFDHPANRPYFSATNSQAAVEDITTTSPARFYRVRVFAP